MYSKVIRVFVFMLACGCFANRPQERHVFSVSVKAQEIKELFTDNARLDQMIQWCKGAGIRKVYLETFRFGYQIEEPLLIKVKTRFKEEGIETAGLVTPTMIGKASTGWNAVCCFSDPATQRHTREIFTYTARHFDAILIDDFWFTDCTCSECSEARKAKRVRVGGLTFAVDGDQWSDYRRELMLRLAEEEVLKPCREVNPNVRVIVKYPCWYDNYQDRGYDVSRAGNLFDATWVGTETRDYNWKSRKGIAPMAAFFLMRWVKEVNGSKCEGAWYDPLWTSPATYLEQARLSILGGADESLLHSYGYLLMTDKEGLEFGDVVRKLNLKGVGGMGAPNGPACFAAINRHFPELHLLAKETGRRRLAGVAAYKPPDTNGAEDSRFFDLLGMAGVPLVPCSSFPSDARAACFTRYAADVGNGIDKINAYIATGRPTLISPSLARSRPGIHLDRPNVLVVPVKDSKWELCDLPEDKLERLRGHVLKAFGLTKFRAPNRTGLVLFRDGSWVLSNFNETPADITVNDETRSVPARGYASCWK